VSARLVKWGFPLMTLGVVSGSLYGKEAWGQYWTWDPRLIVSLLVWILYAALLHARLVIGWRGRKAAILTVVGVIATFLAFVGFGLAGVGQHAKDFVS
jgi:ABC-type transport system involved in cytochrome c biogenesis permease subunit